MTFYVGSNMRGYLPEGDVHECETFDDAKSTLIDELKFMEGYSYTESEAEDYSHASEDVNHWTSQDSILVGNLVYWISEEN